MNQNSSGGSPLPTFALIGLAGYGQTHLNSILHCEQQGLCRLTSVVAIPGTTEEEREGVGPKVRVYASFDAWLDAEANRTTVCCLPVPIHLHASMACAALAAGCSVLLEKPLAASWPETMRLTQTRPSPGSFFAIGFQYLYLKQTHELKNDLLAGRYGCLHRIKLMGLWPRADAYYSRNEWAGRLEVKDGAVLDSPLNNAFSHFFLLALFLAGDSPHGAATVTGGLVELYRSRKIESFDTSVMRLESAQGVEVWCGLTHSCPDWEAPSITLETDDAQIVWIVGESLTIYYNCEKPSVRMDLPCLTETRIRLHETICRRAGGQDDFICSPALAAAHAAVVLDIFSSCPIHQVAPLHVRPMDIAGSPGECIEDVQTLFHRLAGNSLLPSEDDVAWSQPPTRLLSTSLPLSAPQDPVNPHLPHVS